VIRQLGGIQHIPRTVGLAEFSGFFKDQSAREVLETIKQDWSQLTLIQKESESLRDPSSSEGYEKWRNLTPIAASKKPCSEDGHQENVEYNQDKFLHVKAELLDRIEKYDELNKKYMMIEGRLAELQEFERKGKEEEVLKADLAAKKIEIRMLKVTFDKEREKVKQLTNRLEVSEKHKERIDTNNNTLNRNNMLLIEKMAKVDGQMDEAAIHARIIRANARRVGRDIFRYRQSLAEIDAFLEKIENRGLAFLPVARDMDEEED